MAKADIKSGSKFQHWTLIDRQYDNGKLLGWLCKCDCGTIKIIKNISTIVSGASSSCGCFRRKNLQVNNPMFKDEVKNKVSEAFHADPSRRYKLDKAIQAMNSQESKDKRKDTNISRYGGISPASNSEVVIKMQNTNLERYGSTSPAGNIDIQNKMAKTCMDRYGVENIMLLPEYQQLISELVSETRRKKGLQTLSTGQSLVDACRDNNKRATSARNVARKYGQAVLEEWIVNYNGAMSGLELMALDILKTNGINAEIHNKMIEELKEIDVRYKPDIKVNTSKSLYIDIDGLYYHSRKDKKYHIDKLNAYNKVGIRLFQFREDEVRYKSKIIASMVNFASNNLDRVGARTLAIGELSNIDADTFMQDNHLMGAGPHAKNLALFNDGIPLMVFSYKKYKDGIDVTRVATACGHSISGGLSRLLSEAVKRENPRFIQSFVDRRYATGFSLEKIGFTLVNITLGWQWTDGKFTYNRLQCRANMDDRKLTEKEQAQEFGWSKIYDAGQAKYVKYLG
jgi:hypothetical protein